MAVAAYASVLSLMRVLDNVQHPTRLRLLPQIQALREKLSFLQNALEAIPSTKLSEETVECLVREIPRIADGAENVIDHRVVDQLRVAGSDDDGDEIGYTSFCRDLDSVIEKIESINQGLTKVERRLQEEKAIKGNNHQEQNREPVVHKPAPSASVVGFEEQLDQIMNKLAGNRTGLEIIPITGMGGIGKTTLARSAYDHPYNTQYFYVRIWLTISQDYRVEDILQGLLNDGVLKKEEGDVSLNRLISKLYQKLYGQRYLIVMDDVWSTESWDDLKWAFPDNGVGSRIIVTTRLSNVAESLGSEDATCSMKFLNEEKSWELFSNVAFAGGAGSHELEEIGRGISKSCSGLPLALVVLAGLLTNSEATVESWQLIAENVHSFAGSADDENVFKILSLSYQHLPIHLKPCFLYMSHYPEDSGISVPNLIKAWVLQGFVKPAKGKTLEESGREYLEDLVGRNLLLARRRGSTGKIKICGAHDLLRELCLKESLEERFLQVPLFQFIANDFDDVCFMCESEDALESLQLRRVLLGSRSTSQVSPLVCGSCKPQLEGLRFASVVQPENVPQTTRCRWLWIKNNISYLFSPRTVHLLWNLQILQVNELHPSDEPVLPNQIWEMIQLRHVRAHYELPDPEKDNLVVLENLQTLATVEFFKCTEEILGRIPNVKKLRVYYDHHMIRGDGDWSSKCHLENLVRLEKLESLSVRCAYVSLDMKSIVFPLSLKKLSLEKCKVSWDDVAVLASLPNLEALKLLYQSVLGEEWSLDEEQRFSRLKYLKLEKLNLVRWEAEEGNFPSLEALVLEDMKALERIPRELGGITDLRSIRLEWGTERVIESAKEIVEEQKGCGYDGLVVHVTDFEGRVYQIQ